MAGAVDKSLEAAMVSAIEIKIKSMSESASAAK